MSTNKRSPVERAIQEALQHEEAMTSPKIFGVSMRVVMKRADHANDKIPIVVKLCCKSLYQNSKRFLKGLQTEGIFRESGSRDRIMYLKEIFDKGEIEKHSSRNGTVNTMDIEDPHVVASLLKLYFRELPEPLMKYENMDPIISVVKSIKGLEQDIEIILKIIKECLKQLTDLQLFVLRALLRLLHETVLACSENKMKAQNLGIVFGQVIFRAPEDNEVQAKDILMNATLLNKAAEIMINHYYQIFNDPLSDEDSRYLNSIFPPAVQFVAHLQLSETEVETKNQLFGIDLATITDDDLKKLSSASESESSNQGEGEASKPAEIKPSFSRLSKLPALPPKFLASLEKSVRANSSKSDRPISMDMSGFTAVSPAAEKPAPLQVFEKPVSPQVFEKPVSLQVSEKPVSSPVSERFVLPTVSEIPVSSPVSEKPVSSPVAEKFVPHPVAEKVAPIPLVEKLPAALPAAKQKKQKQAPPPHASGGEKGEDEDWVFSGDKEVEDIDNAMSDFYSLVIFLKRSGNKEMHERLQKIYSVIHPAVYDTSNELNQAIPHKYLLSLNKQVKAVSQQEMEQKLAAEHLKFNSKIAAMRNALQQAMNDHF